MLWYSPPQDSGPLLSCLNLTQKTLRTPPQIRCSNLQTRRNWCIALGPMEQDCQRRQATHRASCPDPVPHMNNPLQAVITFVSRTLFFIYCNRWILEMVYMPVPKQTLRYTCRNDIGSACGWSSLKFLHTPPLRTLCRIWCQGKMGDKLWATEILLPTVISSDKNLIVKTLGRKKLCTHTHGTCQLLLMITS